MAFNIKLCDMGNACYIDRHYSDIIQTREYRSPEVILEGVYDESADIWSLACMLFELITGDYLFDPKKGKTYKKNDDHLALITELIGEMKGEQLIYMRDSCEAWDDFYTAMNRNQTSFKLKRIKNLKVWPLFNVLTEKYRMKEYEASLLSKFLNRMLQWSPKARASARDLLNDPWLKVGEFDDNSFMSRGYFKEWKKAVLGEEESEDSSSESSHNSDGDDEENDSENEVSSELSNSDDHTDKEDSID